MNFYNAKYYDMLGCGKVSQDPTPFFVDHLGGFDKNYENSILKKQNEFYCGDSVTIFTEYIFTDYIKEKYKNINFEFSANFVSKEDFVRFKKYRIHPELTFKNFLCSFNGSGHVSRQLLTAILKNQNYFSTDYCSKNFCYSNECIVGHLEHLDLTVEEQRLYNKFLINDNEFNNTIYSFGHIRFEHEKNIYNLQNKLTESFLHIVSETLATSYYPYYSEKFMYSIVTRGLFLSYAQPNWHAHLSKYYGFKLYNKIFDYSFDGMQNPVKRLVKLIEVISKFSKLSPDEWHDLYNMEADTVEFNYNHYFSGDYLKHLKAYA
jgi:hypothetical protein